MTTPLEVSLAAILGDAERVSTAPQVVGRLSRDFYWYSPVLRKQLDGKVRRRRRAPAERAEKLSRFCATAMSTTSR